MKGQGQILLGAFCGLDPSTQSPNHKRRLLPLNMLLLHALAMAVLRLFIRSASFAGHPKARLSWRGRKAGSADFLKPTVAPKNKAKPNRGFTCTAPHWESMNKQPPFWSASGRRLQSVQFCSLFSLLRAASQRMNVLADHIDYLPWDTPRNIREFASILNPKDTILIKYELWPALIRILSDSGTRIHLVASRFDRGRHPATVLGFLDPPPFVHAHHTSSARRRFRRSPVQLWIEWPGNRRPQNRPSSGHVHSGGERICPGQIERHSDLERRAQNARGRQRIGLRSGEPSLH